MHRGAQIIDLHILVRLNPDVEQLLKGGVRDAGPPAAASSAASSSAASAAASAAASGSSLPSYVTVDLSGELLGRLLGLIDLKRWVAGDGCFADDDADVLQLHGRAHGAEGAAAADGGRADGRGGKGGGGIGSGESGGGGTNGVGEEGRVEHAKGSAALGKLRGAIVAASMAARLQAGSAATDDATGSIAAPALSRSASLLDSRQDCFAELIKQDIESGVRLRRHISQAMRDFSRRQAMNEAMPPPEAALSRSASMTRRREHANQGGGGGSGGLSRSSSGTGMPARTHSGGSSVSRSNSGAMGATPLSNGAIGRSRSGGGGGVPAELRRLKLGELRRRARGAGHAEAAVDAALDSEDARGALLALILSEPSRAAAENAEVNAAANAAAAVDPAAVAAAAAGGASLDVPAAQQPMLGGSDDGQAECQICYERLPASYVYGGPGGMPHACVVGPCCFGCLRTLARTAIGDGRAPMCVCLEPLPGATVAALLRDECALCDDAKARKANASELISMGCGHGHRFCAHCAAR